MSEIKSENILTELICFEKALRDQVNESLEEAFEPFSDLEMRTRKLELDMAGHVAGDETDVLINQIKEINHKLNDPEKGIQIGQRELYNTLKNFKEEGRQQLQQNQEAHNKFSDSQKEMRKEIKEDLKYYDEKLDSFEKSTTDKFDEIKKDITKLRIGGVLAVCFLAVLILSINPEAAIKIMRIASLSIIEAFSAIVSLIL